MALHLEISTYVLLSREYPKAGKEMFELIDEWV